MNSVPPVRRLVRRSFSEGGSLGEVGSVVKISVLENESTFGKRSRFIVGRGSGDLFTAHLVLR